MSEMELEEEAEGLEVEGMERSEDEEGDVDPSEVEKLKAEIIAARKKIAALSKEKKQANKENESEPLDESKIDAILERREFYKSNPSASEHKDEIEELYSASKGKFSRWELLAKLTGDDEIEENREVYGKSSVSGKQSQGEQFSAVSVAQFDKMTPESQKAYVAKSKAKFGWVNFKD